MKKKSAKQKRKPARGRRATKVIQLSSRGPRSRPKLSRGRKDRVKWKNNDSMSLKIRFAKWPFTGSKRTFSVAAGRLSKTFTVGAKKKNGKYRYAILVPTSIRQPKGPPDPPGVSVGD